MSLHLHLSARSLELLDALRPALAAARSASVATGKGVPQPVPVLVPSAQIGDWLQARLARDLGLSMGFEFVQPAEYFSRQFTADSESKKFAEASGFWAPRRLRWHLLPLVDTVAHQLGHDSREAIAPRDRFAFAQILAQQFDRYSRFRPDWPERWASNQSVWRKGDKDLPDTATVDEVWQRSLWHMVAGQPDSPPHPAQLLTGLDAVKVSDAASPVFVVGTTLLDPLMLRTLDMLSRRGRPVALYLLLPSLGYLGDISRRHSWRAQLATKPAVPEDNKGHPLLASLGQQAVGTFLLLDSISPDYAQWPEAADAADAPSDATLLQRLQDDIRQQRAPIGPPLQADQPDPRHRISATDQSLRVHCCHSPRRELEVLRDELLRAFADLPGLKPEDVMIAVTDFDAYAPLAEGILRSGPHPLPVRLTAVAAREANPIALALLALLRLSLGRHTASELVDLLNLSAIQHHLDLAGEAGVLSQLADAIRNSGLTHGLDADDRGTKDATGTWRTALDRHLAGAWLGPVEDARDADGDFVHPLAGDLHHNDGDVLRFAGWLTHLAVHLRSWRSPAPAAEWAERLDQAVNDLLQSDESDDHAAALRRLLGELAAVSATTPLDAGSMLDWLQPQLENATSLRTSMGGEILLGRLNQLHGLPCRVLAILGLQDGAFPRASSRPAWDLLVHRSERWDGDPRIQDRQWFLDSLLTPTDRFILCASNRSLRTPHDGPLSSCVEELLRVAADTVLPAEGREGLEQQIVVRHRIQPFAAEYFAEGTSMPRSFDAGAARIAGDMSRLTTESPLPFFTGPLEEKETPAGESPTLTVAQLVAFWKDPVRGWLRAMQLELSETETDDTALDDAPLSLDGLQAYSAREEALASQLPGASCDGATASSRLIADRALPPGALGALAWELRNREVKNLAQGLAPILPQTKRCAIDLPLSANIRLIGEVQLVATADDHPSVIVYRPGKYEKGPRHQLEAFIKTIVASVQIGGAAGCRVLSLDPSSPKNLPAVALEDARRHLDTLVEGYRHGQRRPLCYAPSTSTVLGAELESGTDEDFALEKARASWSQEPFENQPGGEGTTPASLHAWRDADPFAMPHDQEWIRWAKNVAIPLSKWWGGPAGQTTAAAPKGSTRKKAR